MTDGFDFSHVPVLDTARLRLRQLRHDDADAIVNLFSDPEVWRYLDNPPVETQAAAVGYVDWQNSALDNRSGLRWGITLRDADTVIGTCGLHQWHPKNRCAEIGYELHPAHWRQGYMTEVVHALVRWGFDNLNLHRIQAVCVVGNVGSARVLEKVGFTLEGVWREASFEHGRFVDLEQYSLLRREYLPDGDGA
jgi:ribosomal-protein-alanine N-acetyltransferase